MLLSICTITGRHKSMRGRHLITWDPFHDLVRGLDQETFGGDFMPAVDVYQKKDDVIVEMEIPGISTDKVDVSVENNVLTVSGSRESKKEVERADYYRREMSYGAFSRSVTLPTKVKGDKAEAKFENGVLKVTLPKAEDVKPRKIEVKVK